MRVILEPDDGSTALGTVVLYFPRFAVRQYPVWLPYELMTLGTALKEAGYRAVLLDERIFEDAPLEAARWAREALFVGISSRPGDQVERAIELFRMLKERFPDTPSVWGGWFPSSFPEACLALSDIDFVVQGAADTSIVELADCLRLRDGDVTGHRGLNGALPGRPPVTNPRRVLEDIDKTPRVDWRNFALHEYVTADGTISHYTSRGCPGSCRFCGVTRLYPGIWSGYSAERVLDDLEYFVDQLDVRIVKMNDVDMFADLDRMRAICRGMVQRNLRIRWIADMRAAAAAPLDAATWDLIARSGCAELELGAETGSEEQLEVVHKECSRADIIKSVTAIVGSGIAARVNFVLGFPDESRESLASSLSLMKTLQDLGPLVRLHFYRYTPSPSTRLGSQTWRSKSERHDGQVPATVQDLNAIALHYQDDRMFWLDRTMERSIKSLFHTYLPLVYYELPRVGSKPLSILLRVTIALARQRLRFEFFRWPFEAALLRLAGVHVRRTREFEWAENEEAASQVGHSRREDRPSISPSRPPAFEIRGQAALTSRALPAPSFGLPPEHDPSND